MFLDHILNRKMLFIYVQKKKKRERESETARQRERERESLSLVSWVIKCSYNMGPQIISVLCLLNCMPTAQVAFFHDPLHLCTSALALSPYHIIVCVDLFSLSFRYLWMFPQFMKRCWWILKSHKGFARIFQELIV